MLKFNAFPGTAQTVEVDPAMIRYLAYGDNNHGNIYSVAEICASTVYQNADNFPDIITIGEKIGDAIAASDESQYAIADSESFVWRYGMVIATLGKQAAGNLVDTQRDTGCAVITLHQRPLLRLVR